MSLQALAWALEQDLPAGPKLMLIALANRADPTTGRCSYDSVVLAREAVLHRNSIGRYLEALVRNGYLRKQSAPERVYYLALDRVAGHWQEWTWHRGEGEFHVKQDDGDDHGEPESRPIGFSPEAQKAEIAAGTASAEAAKAAQRFFVIRHTPAWDAWCAYHKRDFPTTVAMIDGKSREGWWFPSLFPPKPENAPEPRSALMTEDDEKELT